MNDFKFTLRDLIPFHKYTIKPRKSYSTFSKKLEKRVDPNRFEIRFYNASEYDFYYDLLGRIKDRHFILDGKFWNSNKKSKLYKNEFYATTFGKFKNNTIHIVSIPNIFSFLTALFIITFGTYKLLEFSDHNARLFLAIIPVGLYFLMVFSFAKDHYRTKKILEELAR